jgi:tRNA G10  N-methylase Trm11
MLDLMLFSQTVRSKKILLSTSMIQKILIAPYGVRETMTKVGHWLGPDIKPIAEEHLPNHIPAKVEYNLQELMADLLEFSANHLELGGRLVYWLPIVRYEIFLWYKRKFGFNFID